MTLYMPLHFAQSHPHKVADLIARFPLATIVTQSESELAANHIPLLYSPDEGIHGVLRGHVARNNAMWRESGQANESLVIFQALDTYITPNWLATKQTTHEVVPTWNYAVVHAYGHLRIHDDEKWLRAAIGRLTKVMEADQPTPWRMGQTPPDYLAARLGEIVGIEIAVTRLLAKWKVSQNRSEEDRAGIVAGLRADGADVAQWMANMVEQESDR